MDVGKIIRERREELGMSQAELARTVGISQPSLHNFEIGKTGRSRYLPEIEQALGLSLRNGIKTSTAKSAVTRVASQKPPMPQDFRVYFMRATNDRGKFVLSMEAFEPIERPTLLATIEDAFGICVYGDDNYPAYKAGDIIFVHPYQPPVPGTDVVLRPSEKGDMRVALGELKAETETEWHIQCYNRKETDKYKKFEWGRCGRIVAKYNRR